MLGRFLSHIATFVALVLFTLGLPFLVVGAMIWGRNLTGPANDGIWPIKMGATVLGPFSAVLWYITFCNLVFHRKAGYFMQFVVFVGTAALIVLLLKLGVHSL